MELAKEMYGVIGSIIGALIALYGVMYKQKIAKMNADIQYLCNQLLAYYELERIYSEKISSDGDGKISSMRVKVLMRDQVEKKSGLVRPGVTRSKIRSILAN